jgi:hypothetical protein
MMLSDADKQIGVILFVNTAIRQEDAGANGAIFDDIWQLGVAIKGARAKQAHPTVAIARRKLHVALNTGRFRGQ